MTAPGPRQLGASNKTKIAHHGYEVRGLRSSKALGIGELLNSACSASATLNRSQI